ncbi:nucleotide-binding alpha-beta plait domain-containing protein [Tanacetum coccineum]
MGSFRSKEDDVSKISTSIFVTNFPDSFSAKDLFHSCKQYGHVVDSFIPTKRTKDGKRFGFVRFINVFNVERLVNNLCTIWVGRSKFHANVARFKREYMKGSVNVDKTKNESNKRKFDGSHKNMENTIIGKSFVSVMKTSRMPTNKVSPPAIVLEDDCLNAKDLTLSLMGRVKEMASLVNLKKALCNEGFDVVKISYLGELWVLLEFETAKAKDSFRGNVGVGSWFSVIKQAYAEFVPEGTLVWVELDGVPFKLRSGLTFKRIAAKWGELLDVDDYDYSIINSKKFAFLSKKKIKKRYNSFCLTLKDGKENSESVNKNSESKLSGHSKYSFCLISVGNFGRDLVHFEIPKFFFTRKEYQYEIDYFVIVLGVVVEIRDWTYDIDVYALKRLKKKKQEPYSVAGSLYHRSNSRETPSTYLWYEVGGNMCQGSKLGKKLVDKFFSSHASMRFWRVIYTPNMFLMDKVIKAIIYGMTGNQTKDVSSGGVTSLGNDETRGSGSTNGMKRCHHRAVPHT